MRTSRTLGSGSTSTSITTPRTAEDYAASSRSTGTKTAYTASLKLFALWCIEQRVPSLPATPGTVAAYFAAMASSGRKVATIRKTKSAIDAAHRLSGYAAPGRDPRVQDVLTGIARELGTAAEQKRPLVTSDIRKLVEQVATDAKGVRDRALLLLGFAGAFRRSELVALTVADLEFVDQGLRVHIRRAKTDQAAAGVVLGIPFGSCKSSCPVRALEAWLERSGIKDGPIFRAITRHGHLGTRALADKAVAKLVKHYAEAAGLDAENYAAHSLRAGLITSAALAGVSEADIARQSRHKSVAVLRTYVRTATVFEANAAARVGL